MRRRIVSGVILLLWWSGMWPMPFCVGLLFFIWRRDVMAWLRNRRA